MKFAKAKAIAVILLVSLVVLVSEPRKEVTVEGDIGTVELTHNVFGKPVWHVMLEGDGNIYLCTNPVICPFLSKGDRVEMKVNYNNVVLSTEVN